MLLCTDCGVMLILQNWSPSRIKENRHICKKCDVKRSYEWRRKNPERYREKTRVAVLRWMRKQPRDQYNEKQRKYHRENYLQVRKIRLRVKKHPQNGYCELCDKSVPMYLKWHHWDDSHPEKGLWVCFRCHQVAEIIDDGLLNTIIEEYKIIKDGEYIYSVSEQLKQEGY